MDVRSGAAVQQRDAYSAARAALAQGKAEAFSKLQVESRKRRRIVIVALVVWLVIAAIVVGVAGPDLLVVGEVGVAVLVVWGVFYLLPSFMGKGNLEELFDQYAARIDELEAAGADLPLCADMADLAAALDYVALPDSNAETSA